MYVDYERAWHALKGEVDGKGSHGRRDLLLRMSELEVECRTPEGQEGFDPGGPRGRIQAVPLAAGEEAAASR